MNYIAKSFVKGLLILLPVVVTAYVIYLVVGAMEGLTELPVPGFGRVPGLGIGVAIVLITLLGILASNVVGRRLVSFMESMIKRVPIIKLLYASLRDLIGAFVGDKRRFDRPVMVHLSPDQSLKSLGFVTCTKFDDPKLANHVAVYMPQSYNVAGNLLVVHESRVEPIDADGAQFLAFIMSGGVAEMNAAKTMLESPLD